MQTYEEHQFCPIISGRIIPNRGGTTRLFWCESSERCAIKEIALKKTN